jgi:NAD(P)-dependent dehydrogenase (short-subunit alcohol dehydrogenase family)
MSIERRVAIVTGASQGIGAGIVQRFVECGFNAVVNSRKVTKSAEVAASDRQSPAPGKRRPPVGGMGTVRHRQDESGLQGTGGA